MNSTKQSLKRICCPILVAMPDTDHEDASILFDAINYKVCLEGMDPNRRRNLMALTRHSWIAGN